MKALCALVSSRMLRQNPVFTLAEGAATSRFLAMIRGMKAPSFMDLALKAAENAGKAGEVPIGCVVVRDYEVIATGGQPDADRLRPDRPCRDHRAARGGQKDRQRAPGRLRPLRDAGALHHVCGRDLLCKGQAALLRRRRPQGRRGRSQACGSSPPRPATTRRTSIPASARARRRGCSGSSFGSGGDCSNSARHAPRRRGIQYAAASRINHRRHGVLDRPSPGDDS